MALSETVIQFSVQRMSCTGCGAEANASCNCGVAYAPKIVRATEAIKANPQKSDRAIAAEIGSSPTTVGKARAQVSTDGHLNERTGRDGKSYPAKQKPKQHRGPRFEAPQETQHDRDLKMLQGVWDAACETARNEFLETITN